MAKKTTGGAGALVRGAKLIKKAIEAGKDEHLADPEPVASAVIKKLVLPNGEPISAGMKELLKVDSIWLGLDFDEEEGDIEALSLEELIEDELGKEGVKTFNEAIEMFEGDCIALGGVSDSLRFLYIGEPDESGEYPVITLATKPKPFVGGFVPFDVWVAQELGALDADKAPGSIAAGYEDTAKALADANGDGRVSFEPIAGEAKDDEDEEDDEDEDEEDEDEEEDAEAGDDADADADDADEEDEDEEDDEEASA